MQYLRHVGHPTDYVRWDDDTDLDELKSYIDPHGKWKPYVDDDGNLVITGHQASDYGSPPTYTIPKGRYIHARDDGSSGPTLVLVPSELVGWSYNLVDAGPSDKTADTITY